MTRRFQNRQIALLSDKSGGILPILCVFTVLGSATGIFLLYSFGADICKPIGNYGGYCAAALTVLTAILGVSVLGTVFIPLCCSLFGMLITMASASMSRLWSDELLSVLLYFIYAPAFFAAAQQGMSFSRALNAHVEAIGALKEKRGRCLFFSFLCAPVLVLACLIKKYVVTF